MNDEDDDQSLDLGSDGFITIPYYLGFLIFDWVERNDPEESVRVWATNGMLLRGTRLNDDQVAFTAAYMPVPLEQQRPGLN